MRPSVTETTGDPCDKREDSQTALSLEDYLSSPPFLCFFFLLNPLTQTLDGDGAKVPEVASGGRARGIVSHARVPLGYSLKRSARRSRELTSSWEEQAKAVPSVNVTGAACSFYTSLKPIFLTCIRAIRSRPLLRQGPQGNHDQTLRE